MAEVTFLMSCDATQGAELRDALAQAGAQVQASEKHMLDGSAATSWFMIATVGITTAPALLRSLTEFLRRNAVTSITRDGITIANPRPEDVERLIRDLPAGR